MSLNDSNFQEAVASGRVVVLFGVVTSGPSKRMSAYLEKVQGTVHYVDAAECRDTCALYGIKAMPATAIFNDGKLIACRPGPQTEEEFLNFCK